MVLRVLRLPPAGWSSRRQSTTYETRPTAYKCWVRIAASLEDSVSYLMSLGRHRWHLLHCYSRLTCVLRDEIEVCSNGNAKAAVIGGELFLWTRGESDHGLFSCQCRQHDYPINKRHRTALSSYFEPAAALYTELISLPSRLPGVSDVQQQQCVLLRPLGLSVHINRIVHLPYQYVAVQQYITGMLSILIDQ